MKTLTKVLTKIIYSFSYWDVTNFTSFRACFKKIKHSGIRRFIKSALFEKNVFLNINETYQNNFWLGGIQTPTVLLDCPCALLSNKGALLLKREKNLIQFFQFGYEILDYKSKLLQIKTSTFPWAQFSEKNIFMLIN